MLTTLFFVLSAILAWKLKGITRTAEQLTHVNTELSLQCDQFKAEGERLLNENTELKKIELQLKDALMDVHEKIRIL